MENDERTHSERKVGLVDRIKFLFNGFSATNYDLYLALDKENKLDPTFFDKLRVAFYYENPRTRVA